MAGLKTVAGLLLAGVIPVAGAAQTPTTPINDAYLDRSAAQLHRVASDAWHTIDESVLRYTARVQQRIAAQIRTPLKDRTLYRNESAARVFWDRDGDGFIQVLGVNSEYPGREYAEEYGDLDPFLDELTIEEAFDPGGDRLVFGFTDQGDVEDQDPDEDEFWVAHPLAPGADSLYLYQSGDTLSLSLPNGTRLNVAELQVLPRVSDVHRITGSLWIEPESGSLVRAVYRLSEQFNAIRDVEVLQEEEEAGSFKYVPGFFKPWTFDMNIVVIEYSLWNLEVWLPRAMRIEGQAAAGILKFPVSMDLAYRIENVVTESDLESEEYASSVTEERHFSTRAEAMAFLASLLSDEDGTEYEMVDARGGMRYLAPVDRGILAESRHLPPPIWDDAPGFASEEDIEEMYDVLADLPMPQVVALPTVAEWGWNRPDLIRYNRVEGPALGGKIEKRVGSFVGPLDFTGSGFFGFADLRPKVRLSLDREGVRRSLQLDAYYDVTPVDDRMRPLNFGNSLSALFFGRDDGDYYMAGGASLTLSPTDTRRQSWNVRAFVERQTAMDNEIDFALTHAFDGAWAFRPNVRASELSEVGAEITVSPWWGTDPRGAQFGMDLYAQGALWRDNDDSNRTGEYGRARVVLRTALPLAGSTWRLGVEAAGGHSWGAPSVQRQWFLGGSRTLRGYPAAAAVGPTFGRARLEVARSYPVGTVSVFGDGGWAGIAEQYTAADILVGVGVGFSALDGLVRLDLSQGLRGDFKDFRVDFYLDALF